MKGLVHYINSYLQSLNMLYLLDVLYIYSNKFAVSIYLCIMGLILSKKFNAFLKIIISIGRIFQTFREIKGTKIMCLI